MLITDDLFRSFLKCKTKAHFQSSASAEHPCAPHEISDWQHRLAEDYKRECTDLLISTSLSEYFAGTPPRQDLMKGQHPFIVDPILTFEDVTSYIHALERTSQPDRNNRNHYVPIRFTPYEKITRNHKLLLAYDAFVLGKTFGRMPASGKLIHGRQKRAMTIIVNEFIHDVESIIGKMRVVLADNAPPDLVLNAHCSECKFESRCRSKAAETDDLSLLRGIKPREVVKLRSRGIFSVTQLSYTFRPRKKSRRSNKAFTRYHQSLKALAIREKRIYVAGAPDLDIGTTPVYLDVEGIPDRDFYYLIGMRLPGVSSAAQRFFWANDDAEEGKIWREFLDVIAATENPRLLHYGSYETAFLRRMQKRYGDAGQKGISVDSLIEAARNVLSTIYGCIYFPTYSNGLKEVASYLGFKWSTPNPSGQRSLLLQHKWECAGSNSAREELIAYNADDCQALEVAVRAIQQLIPEASNPAAAIPYPGATHVDSLKPAWPYRLGRVDFALPELDTINKSAYWDYQRDRIYLRANSRLRPVYQKKHHKRHHSLRVNATVFPSRPSACPKCNSKKIEMDGRNSRLIYDLRFFSGGLKKWVTEYITKYYQCKICESRFPSDKYPLTRHRYGLHLLAYVIYNLIELHIPQFKLSQIVEKTFHFRLGQPMINRMKQRAVNLYRETYEDIKCTLRHGRLIHADETHLSAKGKSSYVWVFTSMEEVIYVWSETREGGVVGEFLKSFTGVLVSDFYAGYDSIDCQQQRCLIHLIRDLNKDVLQEPFNEEIKEVVHEFTALLKPIIQTIDRFALKTYHLKKHKKNVRGFFDTLLQRRYQTELAQKAQERFRRNERRLFTFLDYDNVPWNNNNAEHAIKAFAGLREVIEGPSTQRGIIDYLILLSICQTCKYRGIDFLAFLRSGEKRIDDYTGKRHH
jgi:predicted RecB family nuclease